MDFDEWIAKLRDRMWASAPGARGRWDAYVAYVHETNISPEIKRDSLEHTEVNLTAAWLKALVPPKMRKSPLMITHGGNIEFVRVLVGRDLLDLSKVGGATGWAVNDGPVRQRLDEETAAQLSITIGTLVTDRALMPPPTALASPMTTGVEMYDDKPILGVLLAACSGMYVQFVASDITVEERNSFLNGEFGSFSTKLMVTFVLSWVIWVARIVYGCLTLRRVIFAMRDAALWPFRASMDAYSRMKTWHRIAIGACAVTLCYCIGREGFEAAFTTIYTYGAALMSNKVTEQGEKAVLTGVMPTYGPQAKSTALVLTDNTDALAWWHQAGTTALTLADPLGEPQFVLCVTSAMVAVATRFLPGGSMIGNGNFNPNLATVHAGFAVAGFIIDNTPAENNDGALAVPGRNNYEKSPSAVTFFKDAVVPGVGSLKVAAWARWGWGQWQAAYDAIRGIVKEVWTNLKATCARWTVGLFGDTIGNMLINLFNSVSDVGAKVAKTIKNGISKVLGDVYAGWRDFFEWVADMMGRASTALQNAYNAIQNGDWSAIGDYLSEGLAHGMHIISAWLKKPETTKSIGTDDKVDIPSSPGIPTWTAASLWQNFTSFFEANATVPDASGEPLQYVTTVDYYIHHPHGSTEWHERDLKMHIENQHNLLLNWYFYEGWIAENPAWTKWREEEGNTPTHAPHVYDPVAGRYGAEL